MLEVRARAKINWTLDILGKREDGYHELDMLMQSITLSDTLQLSRANQLSMVIGRGIRVWPNEDNLVMRAARALQAHAGVARGAEICLSKHIPVGAGLGGGSADAAGVLVGLNALWGLGLPVEELAAIGLEIGADVPFCLYGGLRRARGVGEVLEPLPFGRALWLVIIQPCRGLSTRNVFAAFNAQDINPATRPRNDLAAQALAAGDVALLTGAMGNVLEPVAAALRPEIHEALGRLRQAGAIAAQMTGSGSAVYGLFPGPKAAKAAAEALRQQYRTCRLACTVDAGVALCQSD
ncbi:MAG: 4-(cytidine 5'-diphospho)-2-C-methyl-D-erythritol kinase [Oscillospiraceae bacterium]|jgi:4-diphosphocytidyl-2-C-methyl-D-erythritol kinase|nr:4-(cytidine 5'-diphospho)-2-C-methyl-D-erythritol kinase [Oscillospiraceae bacterium]